MSDTNQTPVSTENWNEFVAEMNENVLDALEQNVEAQTTFVEAWMETLDGTSPEETFGDGVEGYARAYEVWMEAAQEQFERTSDAIEGEDVPPEEFRDIWLNSANEAFKEVMSTTAFAAATGETVESALELQQQADETAEKTLHALGFPTESDIEEVGERLVELERRQHDVEQEVDGVGQRFDSVEDRIVTVDDRIATVDDRIITVDDRIATVDDRIARFGERLDGFEDNFDEFEDDFEDVGEQLYDVSENVDDVGDRLAVLDDVAEDVDGVGDRLDALEEQVDAFEDRFDTFEDRFDRLDEKLDELTDADAGDEE